MKLKALSLAIAAASILPQSAFALLPKGGIDPTTVSATYTLRFAGASAEDNLIFDTMLKDICSSNITVLNKPGTTSLPHKLSNYFGVACKAKTTSGTNKIDSSISGQNVLLLKRSEGGSAYGVNTLLESPPRQISQIDPSTCTVLDGTYTSTIASVGTVDAVKCTNTTAPSVGVAGNSLAADAGISDVNPEMFKGANTPAGFSAVVPATVSPRFGSVKGVVAQVFGVVVSTNLRNNLQTAQFGAGNACVGSDTEACMPSLSKELVASLFTGKVTQWNQIQVNSGGTPKAFTTLPGIVLPSPTSATSATYPVKVCRRVPGSGTQATINNVILDTPCSTAGLTPLVGNTANVTQGAGSSDTANCLTAWNTGTPKTIATDKTPGTVTVGATGVTGWAIGLMGLEKADANFKFVKLDGVAPSAKNVHDGKYQLWSEATIQYRVDVPYALVGAKLGFINTIKALVGNAANLATLNSLLPAPAYMALSTVAGQTPDAIYKASNPVVAFTHTTTNTDNCRVPTMNNNSAVVTKTPGF